jgi:hypothetical protein
MPLDCRGTFLGKENPIFNGELISFPRFQGDFAYVSFQKIMVMYLLISEEYSSRYHLLWVFIISLQGHLNLKNIFVISVSNFHKYVVAI